MKDDNAKRTEGNRVWLAEDSCDLDAFRRARGADRQSR